MKKIRAMTASALAVILAAANCVSVSAAGKITLTKDDIVNALNIFDEENGSQSTVKRLPTVDVSGLPSKFDLRDVNGKNYVSPVKNQGMWMTCWSFGATAAAESSIAYELGHDYNAETGSDEDNLFDLSEKHLAWFSYVALPEDSKEYPSQAGEGYHFDFTSEPDPAALSEAIYKEGGYMNYATAMFSAGMGPTLEAIVPYEETTVNENPVITLYVYEMTKTGDLSCTKTEYDSSETSVEELRKEWLEKGYTEDAVPDGAKFAYMFVTSGITHMDVTPEQQEQMNDEKRFIAYVDNSTADWTLDESQRFLSFYTLTDGNMLPSPALKGENGEYIFNQAGVDAIKSELVNGRAVSITFLADQSKPGDVLNLDGGYISLIDKDGSSTTDQNAEYWAQYTYDKEYDPTDKNSVNKKLRMTHAVCIVGYDDDFPKEYFNDPNGTIGGNGAFLVKNSWGTRILDDNGKVINTWGNAGSGYFWMSYYDQSLDLPESFDFDTEKSLESFNIDMYDFIPNSGLNSKSFDGDVYMANVFTAQNNCTVRYIGLESAEADIDVEYTVYLLNEDAKSPVDGLVFAEAAEHYNYAGYHVVDIGKTFYLPKGTRYSIVAKADADGKSDLFYAEVFNEHDISGDLDPATSGYDVNIKGIINPGESFVGTSLEDPDAWIDWSDVTSEMRERSLEFVPHGTSYDNFPIRSYPQTEPFTIFNLNAETEKETYKAGDKLTGVVMVQNNSGLDISGIIDLMLTVTVGSDGESFTLAEISSLEPGKAKEYTYEYTVTEKDVAAGEVTSTVTVNYNDEAIDYGALFGESLTFTVKTEGGSSSVDAAEENNPATGNELFSAAVLAGAAAAIAAVSRKRR